jgi:hypothetical protein
MLIWDSGAEWKDLYVDGTANIDSLIADTADINGGTIDGTVVGGTTPAAGTFTLLTSTSGRIKNSTRVTGSPYNILSTDEVIFVDTDGGAITVNLPVGVDGTRYQIANTGSSGNDITLTPNGAELLFGVNGSETLIDSENFIVTYETTEGWW